jgi:hypothetical protein
MIGEIITAEKNIGDTPYHCRDNKDQEKGVAFLPRPAADQR